MNKSTEYLKPYSPSFWKAYLIQMRPYLMFVSGISGLAGMSIAGTGNFDIYDQLLAFAPLFLGYGFGQALTDCFQLDTDIISAPYRPLSQGLINVKWVMIVSIAGLLLISGILVYLNSWNILLCLLSIVGLASYSIVKKRYWFAGPFYNAWIVALLPVMGYISLTGQDLEILAGTKIQLLIALSFFSYAHFVLIGYLKDISADKAAGYKTLPVVFGWNWAVRISTVFTLASIWFCYKLVDGSIPGLIVMIIASLIVIGGQLYAFFTENKTESNSVLPISSSVRGFILWHISVILAFRPDLIFVCFIYYCFFELSFYLRPEKNQI